MFVSNINTGMFQRSPMQRKSLTPPAERKIPVVKTKDSPTDSSYGVQSTSTENELENKSQPSNIDNIITEINDKFADSPVTEDIDMKYRTKIEPDSENVPQTKVVRTRRKIDISPVKIEQEPVTPSRRTRQHDTELSAPVEAVVTPTRSSRRTQKTDSDDDISHEPSTPSRSTRVGLESDTLQTQQQESVTPTRSTRRRGKKGVEPPTHEDESLTPGRSSRRKTLKSEEKKEGKLTQISVKSPKPFSPNAREAVQESLLQISADLKERMESPPGKMTKIKDKVGTSPARTSPARTPTRSRKGVREELTPTRKSSRLASKSEDTDNDENAPVTPSRSGRTRAAKSGATPKRGKKKQEENQGSPVRNKNDNRSMSPSKSEIEDTQPAKIKRTPTRGRRKQEESFIEVIETVEAKTPPRKSKVLGENSEQESKRDSFGMSEIPTDYEDVENTPSRRQSLSRSCKKSVKENETEKTPTRRRSIGREARNSEIGSKTPTRKEILSNDTELSEETVTEKVTTRRQSLSRETVVSEEIENVKTPTRKKKVDKVKLETKDEETTDTDIESQKSLKRTPSRRGRSKKSEVIEEEKAETKTPSRRGGRKKVQSESEKAEVENTEELEDVKEALSKSKRRKRDEGGSPSAHTRSHDRDKNNDVLTQASGMFPGFQKFMIISIYSRLILNLQILCYRVSFVNKFYEVNLR